MINDDLYSVQTSAIGILKAFISICQKHGLRYYALYGTCLGAVRHQGFIPWDDDIDVGMPRRDYDKFMHIAQEELPSQYFLQNYQTEKEYLQHFSKIRDTNTTFIETDVAHLHMNHGVYIDVYPLDGVPENQLFRKILYTRLKFLQLGIYGHYISDTRPLRLRSKIVRQVMKSLYKPVQLHRKWHALAAQYDYDQSDLVCYYGSKSRHLIPREYFREGTEMKFEDLQVIVPGQYDKFLTTIYGNYMTLPPQEKQVSHHETLLIDVAKSYKDYTD